MTCKGSPLEGRKAGRERREAKEEKERERWGREGRRQNWRLDWIETISTRIKALVAVPVHTIQK